LVCWLSSFAATSSARAILAGAGILVVDTIPQAANVLRNVATPVHSGADRGTSADRGVGAQTGPPIDRPQLAVGAVT
jgi:hypothetical protein